MKKTITRFAFVLFLLTLLAPKTAAIITDPEDYVWYDTGKLGLPIPLPLFPTTSNSKTVFLAFPITTV